METAMSKQALSLRVVEALKKDVGLHVVRIDKKDMSRLGIKPGDIVLMKGKKKTLARAMHSLMYDRGNAQIQMDGVLRENAGVGLDESVEVARAAPQSATQIRLSLIHPDTATRTQDTEYIRRVIQGMPLMVGNQVRVRFMGSGFRLYRLTDAEPAQEIVIGPQTEIEIEQSGTEEGQEKRKTGVTYEDIGGLWDEIQRIREMIELPLKHPQVFQRLGIDPPKGVLLHGPPGTGKTLIAKAVANEANIHFISVNGPEIVNKFYGESEAQLRGLFEEAAEKAPSILFIDEIDAISPKRTEVTGEVEKRIVAQLLALMDGLKSRGEVIVIGATNIPNVIDPALRRPGRFDREIATKIPDKQARLEILQIHTLGMPLGEDVALEKLAEITHGFVGADLEALCREAALYRLRTLMETTNMLQEGLSMEFMEGLSLSMDDFLSALKMVDPSAIREIFVEIPEVHWGDIGGLEQVKARLQQIVEWPIQYRELYRELDCPPPRGILLTGPPGTGKTMLGKALATETQRNFIAIKGPELLSKWVGESEKGIREVFRKARLAAPSILFFDEIDAVIPVRGAGEGDSRVTEKVISQFLTEMDGVEVVGDVIVLAATNRPDLLDPAILRAGRFDVVLELDVPDLEARKKILSVQNEGRPVSRKVDVDEVALLTEGFVGSEIAWVCDRALGIAIGEYIHDHPSKCRTPPFDIEIRKKHFLRALDEYKSRKKEWAT
jgi:transitional endoplasmic reticulum ATPase